MVDSRTPAMLGPRVDREVMLRILEKLIEKEPSTMVHQARLEALVGQAWHAAKKFEQWAEADTT